MSWWKKFFQTIDQDIKDVEVDLNVYDDLDAENFKMDMDRQEEKDRIAAEIRAREIYEEMTEKGLVQITEGYETRWVTREYAEMARQREMEFQSLEFNPDVINEVRP